MCRYYIAWAFSTPRHVNWLLLEFINPIHEGQSTYVWCLSAVRLVNQQDSTDHTIDYSSNGWHLCHFAWFTFGSSWQQGYTENNLCCYFACRNKCKWTLYWHMKVWYLALMSLHICIRWTSSCDVLRAGVANCIHIAVHMFPTRFASFEYSKNHQSRFLLRAIQHQSEQESQSLSNYIPDQYPSTVTIQRNNIFVSTISLSITCILYIKVKMLSITFPHTLIRRQYLVVIGNKQNQPKCFVTWYTHLSRLLADAS